MNRRKRIYVSEDLAERLAATASQRGLAESELLSAALRRVLDEAADQDDQPSVEQRLAGMSRQLERLDHELRVVNEIVAMHARYHLAVTPLFPEAEQPAACALGSARFDEFAAQVGRRLHIGKPLMRETLGRLGATRPDLLPSEESAAVYDLFLHQDRSRIGSVPSDVHEPTARPAAAREVGSNDGFHKAEGYSQYSTVWRREP